MVRTGTKNEKKKILLSEQIYVIDEKVTTEILQWEYEKDNKKIIFCENSDVKDNKKGTKVILSEKMYEVNEKSQKNNENN